MSTLLLPVAGKSSRFPGMRPKWLLTMPSGRLMLEESCKGLELAKYDRIVVVCLQEHLDEYVDEGRLLQSLRANLREDVEICALDSATSSHAETVYEGILKAGIIGPVYLKDCDNVFKDAIHATNVIATIDLNDVGLIDAKNKSYVEISDIGHVTNIIEKKVISNYFCCGGYSFESARAFCDAFEGIRDQHSGGEIYVSHVVYRLMLNGEVFSASVASDYVDWGTVQEYRDFCGKHLTVFCDVDGVLLENGSKFGKDGWASEAIKDNVRVLAGLQKKGLLYLVVTTSRPIDERSYVEDKLRELGLKVDQYVASLPHTKRALINDFSATNPYPSAVAINLERNSLDLGAYMSFLSM